MRIYYFGCLEQYGHFLIDHECKSVRMFNGDLPWEQIDGALCPDDTQKEGVVKIHHAKGWTAAAFWDNSIDHRPKSNSVFFFEDLLDFDEVIMEFKKTFPKIYNRFDFELIEWVIPEERVAGKSRQ